MALDCDIGGGGSCFDVVSDSAVELIIDHMRIFWQWK